MADRFLIAAYDSDSGLQTNLKPFAIPDQAFSQLNNAYVFRGRVRKRFGTRFLSNFPWNSRLGVQIGVTAGFPGVVNLNVRAILGDAGMPTAAGQAFSVGNDVFIVFDGAAGNRQMHRTDLSGAAATYNLGTSALAINNINSPAGTVVWFYPSFPVMGFLTYQRDSSVNEFSIAFDTRYAYFYDAGLSAWSRLDAAAAAGDSIWTGNDSQFFWGCIWSGADPSTRILYVTNFNQNEVRYTRYFDGIRWNSFAPQINGADFLFSARIIVPFRNRLLFLNTWEGNPLPGANYPNRCRYSAVGSPLAVNSFRQDIAGNGNAIDASTTEAIITVEFIKDRLIVFFERSTWELAYTGNQAHPFSWQKINTELGAESTFSVVPFDKVALCVGSEGIHSCNGGNVERIDLKIPQTVFDIHNVDEGAKRVNGIRDYYVEAIYWAIPSTDSSAAYPYPNKVLVYNYRTGSWAFNDDSITCFGYFKPLTGIRWSSTAVSWSSLTPWSGGQSSAQFRQVIGGNQQGFTFIVDPDAATNCSAIQITDINILPASIVITAINHNMRQGEYIYLSDIAGIGTITLMNDNIFQIVSVTDENTFDIISPGTAGAYSGGGLFSRVSNINITTKEYNFYAKQGRNAYVSRVDFLVDSTGAGEIQVDCFVSSSTNSLVADGALSGALIGAQTLDTYPYTAAPASMRFEGNATRLWHPVYFQADGEYVQLQLSMNDAQMRDVDIRDSGFQMHAICIYATPTAYGFK